MNIKILGKSYRAVSPIFVETLESESYTYPAPIYLNIYMPGAKDSDSKINTFEVRYPSFTHSILPLDFYFSAFMYLLTFDYKLSTFHVEGLTKDSVDTTMHGFKGIFNFEDGNVNTNVGLEEIYDDFKKVSVQYG